MKKPTPLIYRLTMKDYGDVPLGALDAMNDAAKHIEKLVKSNEELLKEILRLNYEIQGMQHD